jgi:hypothetical protein
MSKKEKMKKSEKPRFHGQNKLLSNAHIYNAVLGQF